MRVRLCTSKLTTFDVSPDNLTSSYDPLRTYMESPRAFLGILLQARVRHSCLCLEENLGSGKRKGAH